MNNTDEMITHKVWAVPLEMVKTNHFPMLKSYDITARCVMDYESFTASNGGTYRYGKEGHAEFDTSSDDQEVVLKLLYGNDLLLKLVAVSMPHSIIQVDI